MSGEEEAESQTLGRAATNTWGITRALQKFKKITTGSEIRTCLGAPRVELKAHPDGQVGIQESTGSSLLAPGSSAPLPPAG